jgi:predicted phage tail protein
MLRKIKLYGKLAKFIGKRVLHADVATAAEAVRFLVANWPEVEKHMADQYYRVSIGTYDLNEDELHDPAGQQIIKIMPVVAGAGGGVGKIIAGIALVALAIVFAPVGAGFLGAGLGLGGSAFTLGASASVVLGGIGVSLVLGGVAQLLSPVPKTNTGTDSEQDPRKSYSFSGVQNVARSGTPVPIVYGETLVGSVVISAGIDTVQVLA